MNGTKAAAKAKHTALPWKQSGELIISDNNPSEGEDVIVARVSYSHHGCDHVQSFEESEANAAFILKAVHFHYGLIELAKAAYVNAHPGSPLEKALHDLLHKAGVLKYEY